MLNWITWNRTVYAYKMYLALNSLQWLICNKNKLNQTNRIYILDEAGCILLRSKALGKAINLFAFPISMGKWEERQDYLAFLRPHKAK